MGDLLENAENKNKKHGKNDIFACAIIVCQRRGAQQRVR